MFRSSKFRSPGPAVLSSPQVVISAGPGIEPGVRKILSGSAGLPCAHFAFVLLGLDNSTLSKSDSAPSLGCRRPVLQGPGLGNARQSAE